MGRLLAAAAVAIAALCGIASAAEPTPRSVVIYRTDYYRWLDSGAKTDALQCLQGFRSDVRYAGALSGFTAQLTPDQINAVRADPDVVQVNPEIASYTVIYASGVDVARTTAELESTLGIHAQQVFQNGLAGIAANLSAQQLDALAPRSDVGQILPNPWNYYVVFYPSVDVAGETERLAQTLGFTTISRWPGGFRAVLDQAQLQGVSADSGVRFIAANGPVPIGPPPTRLVTISCRDGKSTVVYGRRITLSGNAQGSAPKVALYAQSPGDTVQRQVGPLSANGGFWTATVKPSVWTVYEARFAGTRATATIEVRPRVALAGLGHRRFKATVHGAHSFAGKLVDEQRRVGGQWQTVAQLTLDFQSSATFRVASDGWMRVVIPQSEAGLGYVDGLSRAVHVTGY
jgi:hypothetical protein